MSSRTEHPIRVAQVMGKFVPGGIKSVLLNRYRSVDRSRVQFDFLVEAGSASAAEYKEVKRLGARVFEIPSIANVAAYNVLLGKVLRDNDYAMVHAYMNTLNVFPMRVAYKVKVPIRIAENLSTAHRGEPKTAIKSILRPFNAKYPTHLAANSEFSAEWMYGARAHECKIIRNAVDLDVFKYDAALRDAVRSRMDWEGRFVVGHIGRFQYQKNHGFLVDVFEEVARAESAAILALVGYGDLQDEIKRKVTERGLGNKVLFLGAREDLAGLYNAFDCFVLPSFYEGLPVVAIEAQATGLSCILSEEVTEEAVILKSTERLAFSAGAGYWADRILSKKGTARFASGEAMRLAGYDARIQGADLTEYYLELYGEFVDIAR